jgi:hypothetical protein
MANAEGGGTKVLRGVVIAIVVVAALVLLAAFHSKVTDWLASVWRFVSDHTPAHAEQRTALVIYMIAAVILSVVFSKAGHFTAYGIAMGLGPLLWILFWEGFPLLSLSPSWTNSMNLGHLSPAQVATWAVVADALITVVFVPLELREKFGKRKPAGGST